MAGAGTKLFVQGEILTAAQTNVYLMDQAVTVFATAAARDAAFGGVGEPTLSEGRICYLESTNLIQFYDGAAWIDSSQFSVGDSTITSAKIVDGAIVNADINASAAIALSKLATGAAATIVLHNSDGVPTATAVSGDVTITNAGVVEIAAGKIVNADINASAAIDLNKIADAVVNAQVASYTAVLTDRDKMIEILVAGANTFTVPPNSSVAFSVGTNITILQTGAGQTTVTAGAGVTINSSLGLKLRAQWSSGTLVKRATDTWVIMGDTVI